MTAKTHAVLRGTVDDICAGAVEADEVAEIRERGLDTWARRVFEAVDGSDYVLGGQLTLRCDLDEIREHGEWLLAQPAEATPSLAVPGGPPGSSRDPREARGREPFRGSVSRRWGPWNRGGARIPSPARRDYSANPVHLRKNR